MKPRMRKSKRVKVHTGRPLRARGWQLELKWLLIARRGFGTDSYQRMVRTVKTHEEATQVGEELIARGWDSVELRSQELLTPVKE